MNLPKWLIAHDPELLREFVIHAHEPRITLEVFETEDGGYELRGAQWDVRPEDRNPAMMARLMSEAGEAYSQWLENQEE
jgi:hypothetical protein